jgi:hypothetical protein
VEIPKTAWQGRTLAAASLSALHIYSEEEQGLRESLCLKGLRPVWPRRDTTQRGHLRTAD